MFIPVLHFLKVTHSAEVDTVSARWSQQQGPFTFLRQPGLRWMVWLLQNTNLPAYVTPLTRNRTFLHSFLIHKHDWKKKAAEDSQLAFFLPHIYQKGSCPVHVRSVFVSQLLQALFCLCSWREQKTKTCQHLRAANIDQENHPQKQPRQELPRGASIF